MLKGHATIELKNVHNGVKEVINHDNLVTRAPEYFLKTPWKLYQGTPPFFGDLNNTLLDTLYGGIAIFDKPIPTDDPNTFTLPPGIDMVGAATLNYSFNNDWPELGSFNEHESVIDRQNKEANLVYDFTTSQANGEIGSLSLCHPDIVSLPYGSSRTDVEHTSSFSYSGPDLINVITSPFTDTIYRHNAQFDADNFDNDPNAKWKHGVNDGISNTRNDQLVWAWCDFDNGYQYFIHTSEDMSKIDIVKCLASNVQITIFQKLNKMSIKDTFTVEPGEPFNKFVYVGTNNKIMYFASLKTGEKWTTSNNLSIFTFNTITHEFTKIIELVNQHGDQSITAIVKSIISGNYLFGSFCSTSILENGLYIYPYYDLTTGSMHSCEYSDFFRNLIAKGPTTSFGAMRQNGEYSPIKLDSTHYIVGTHINVNGCSFNCILNVYDKSIKPSFVCYNLGSTGNYSDNGIDILDQTKYAIGLWEYREWGVVVKTYPFYLATINNLDSIITKTPDKTMKIIYTLREEQGG